MHPALLLAVALQLEPNPPYHGEAATLTVTTAGETEPLRVDMGNVAMLRRVPDGATVERIESTLHLRWHRAPERARVELVLRADKAAYQLKVTAVAGTSTATLAVQPLRRDAPSPHGERSSLAVLAGLALSLLMWPTFRLNWRHFRTVGVLTAVAGTYFSVLFVRIWWKDLAAMPDYREGRCVITDRMLVYEGKQRTRSLYSGMYAVDLDDHPRIAGDSDTSGWPLRDPDAHAELRRFEIGKSYPCWWSVRDRNEVLLEPRRRGVTQRTVLTIAAFLILIAPGWFRPGFPPRRRR